MLIAFYLTHTSSHSSAYCLSPHPGSVKQRTREHTDTMKLSCLILWDNSILAGQRSLVWGQFPQRASHKHGWSTFNTQPSFSTLCCEVLQKVFEESVVLAFPTPKPKTLFPLSSKSSSSVLYLTSSSSSLPLLHSALYFLRRNFSHLHTPAKGHGVTWAPDPWSHVSSHFPLLLFHDTAAWWMIFPKSPLWNVRTLCEL